MNGFIFSENDVLLQVLVKVLFSGSRKYPPKTDKWRQNWLNFCPKNGDWKIYQDEAKEFRNNIFPVANNVSPCATGPSEIPPSPSFIVSQ